MAIALLALLIIVYDTECMLKEWKEERQEKKKQP